MPETAAVELITTTTQQMSGTLEAMLWLTAGAIPCVIVGLIWLADWREQQAQADLRRK